MRKFFIIIVVLFFAEITSAQNDTIKFRNNSAYIELLGNIGGRAGMSFNYERKIYEHRDGFFTARVGGFYFSHLNNYNNKLKYLYSTALINHIFSKGNNHFEMGFGVRLIATNYLNYGFLDRLEWDKEKCVPTANFSYRYQKPRGRFLFRAGWTPLIFPSASPFNIGISSGFTF